MKWIKEEEQKAIVLLQSGLNYEEIGEILSRTRKSIKEKLGKLGYKRENYIVNSIFEIKCLECEISFQTSDSNRKFCCQSCAASYNNKKFVKRKSNKKKYTSCLQCNNSVNNNNKFCSQTCHQDNLRLKKLKNGTLGPRGIKKILIKEKGEKCEDCGWNEVNKYTGNIPIELEHIDGNSQNNDLSNLKLLCPNCHSLTKTYKGANKGNGRHNRMQRYHNNQSY